MTRINVGIKPIELCDQHLVAEYRELPRVFGHIPKGFVPDKFTLGKGHVNWCAMFQMSLRMRQHQICKEMIRRGITVNYFQDDEELGRFGCFWSDCDESTARHQLQARINERLSTMKRKPMWTACEKPDWVDI